MHSWKNSLSGWSSWSAPVDKCLGGQQTRSRIITDKGTSECPHLEESKICEPVKCGSNAECEQQSGQCKCKDGFMMKNKGR